MLRFWPMRGILTAAAALLALVPGMARAADLPCLSPAEFASLSTYSLPSMISGTTQRCAASLPPDSWLSRNGAGLAQRYAALRPQAWPGAKAAFVKVAPAVNPLVVDIMGKLPDETLQPLVDAWVEALVAQQLPLERCGKVDRLVRLLSPLPAESTAELLGLAIGLGAKSGGGRFGKLAICGA